MSIPLIDFRGKVTPETDAVLEAILSDVALPVIRARSIALRMSETELIREVLDEWALKKIDIARHIESALSEVNGMGSKTMSFKKIPRRRRNIFDASSGKCHYCNVALEIAGKWHVDHKMPKALMGGDEPENLVASCIKCNLAKRDRTDKEFIAERAM